VNGFKRIDGRDRRTAVIRYRVASRPQTPDHPQPS